MTRSSFRFKLIIIVSLLLMVVGLVIFSVTRRTTHAASAASTLSTKPATASTNATVSCGAWRVVSTGANSVQGFLNGVAPISTNDAWAVGSTPGNRALIKHWNGTHWHVVAHPNPGLGSNNFNGVAAVSTNDVWAVGNYYNTVGKTLIEHWNGTTWNLVTSPNSGSKDNSLSGITALSTSNIWAVGYYINGSGTKQTLIEHWNGSAWSIVVSPNSGSRDNVLSGVAAVSTNDIWTVGDASNSSSTTQTLTEHWNGTSWSIITNPGTGSSSSSGFFGVSIVSTNNVWAVGFNSGKTLTEHWNGSAWSIVASPTPGSQSNGLYGVTAISAKSIWAVGTYYNSNGFFTLIEHWNGTKWSVVSSPSPGINDSELYGVARVPGTKQVWAVGLENISSSGYVGLIEFYC